MTITNFHQRAMQALSAAPDNTVLTNLIKQAHELTDMTGWADSIIDKEYKVSDAFAALKDKAKAQYESTDNKNIAILHDAINDLLSAIYKHDTDLTPSTFADNDDTV
ncbi:MAG: hypothetical protein HAW58_05900 [Candidatus Thioglobus sp.]|nr:hypothetical protein [Candidatus Thioglobus sp.]